MQITEEQELLLQELYNVINDGQTPPEIIDMMVASYRNLFAQNNPYANEVHAIIEMKKNNPGFHIEFTDDGACYKESEKTIYLEDLIPGEKLNITTLEGKDPKTYTIMIGVTGRYIIDLSNNV